MTGEVERAIADLSGDPLLVGADGSLAPLIVWSASIERVLYASRSAAGMSALVADAGGRVRLDHPALTRLKALAGGLASHDRFRLELLRLGRDRLSPSTMLACRLVELPDGAALLTIIVGGVPSARRHRPAEPGLRVAVASAEEPPTETECGPPGPDVSPPSAPPEPQVVPETTMATEPLARASTVGPRRFLWSTDARGRITAVSPGLAGVVGPDRADILGLTWEDLAHDVVVDPDGAVVEHLASGQAWHDLEIGWYGAEPDLVIPVTLGAVPIRASDGRIEGFRGSGHLRPGDARKVPSSRPPRAEPLLPRAEPFRPTHEHTAKQEPDGDIPPLRSEFASLRAAIGAQLGGDRAMPFKAANEPSSEAGTVLSFAERGALHEIARALGARVEADLDAEPDPARPSAEIVSLPSVRPPEIDPLRILDRLPVGIAVLRGDTPIFLNAKLLNLLGYADLAETVARGGGAALVRGERPLSAAEPATLVLAARSGRPVVVEAEWTAIAWGELPATLITLTHRPKGDQAARLKAVELDLAAERARLTTLAAALEIAEFGTAELDASGRVRFLSSAAERLFGYAEREIVGEAAETLFAPESRPAVTDLLGGHPMGRHERRVLARLRDGRDVPVLLSVGTGVGDRAILVWRPASDIVVSDRSQAAVPSSRFLARVSHEIRTPVNAIVGFAGLMLEERFGPVGNERYRGYLRDIQRSGEQVVSLLTGLMDVAEIGAGSPDLVPASLDLNNVVADSVARLQPSASREHVVMRTSLGQNLPRVVADERSLRRIALNVLSNAIQYTGAGGQVIVSTARTDRGEMAFRVRDTGTGMTPAEIDAALQPFGLISETKRDQTSQLGLPLSKALAEANRASFSIASGRSEGTLVEIVFPAAREAAE